MMRQTCSFTLAVLAILSVQVCSAATDPLTITTPSLPDGILGKPYSAFLQATGGTAPYTWSIIVGKMPGFYYLNAVTGEIYSQSGAICICDGNFQMTFQVKDATGQAATKVLAFNILDGLLHLTTQSLPNAQIGVPYSATLNATGGTPPYTWSLSGLLPSGLTFDASAGKISGTATVAGSTRFKVTVSDSSTPAVQTDYAFLSLAAVSGPPVITTKSLPNGSVGVPYSAVATATGGVGPYTWSATGLPVGLTINATTGVISGTVLSGSTTTPAITVTDSAAPVRQSATVNLTLTIGDLTITTSSLPAAIVNTQYSVNLNATGGVVPYTWSASGLPQGLSINAATGVISGTPTAPATATVTVAVRDSSIPAPQSTTSTLSLTVLPTFMITTTSLPAGSVNTVYNAALAVNGGTAPFTWSLAGGSALPNGLSLNPSTGAISGVPTAPVANLALTIKVTDSSSPTPLTASKTLTLTITSPSNLAITTSSLPDGVVGKPYYALLQAAGGVLPYTWSIIVGKMPGFYVLNPVSGEITSDVGALCVCDGNFQMTFQVKDAIGQTATRVLAINMTDGLLHLTTRFLPVAQVGVPYSFALAKTGGNAPYAWSMSGTLPSGLSFDASAGIISGTPALPGSAVVTFTVKDSSTPVQSDYGLFTLSVVAPSGGPGALQILTTALPDGVAGSTYSATVNASGGTPPYVWSASGLPSNLTMNSSTGAITGTPSAAGTSPVSLTVKDAISQSVTVTLSLRINLKDQLTITTGSLPSASLNTAYTAAATASGGVPPYTWSAAGLPAGLQINPAGVISGTPTTVGTSTVTLTVSDSQSPAAVVSKSMLLSVSATPKLTITTTALPNGVVRLPYTGVLTATGGTGPYTYFVSGAPPNLGIFANSGDFTGTPQFTGVYPVVVTVKDSSNPQQVATANFTITIVSGLTIITTSMPNGSLGGSYYVIIASQGGGSTLDWTATGLPPGINIRTETEFAVITGTPTSAGTFTVTVKVTDENNQAATANYTIVIAP